MSDLFLTNAEILAMKQIQASRESGEYVFRIAMDELRKMEEQLNRDHKAWWAGVLQSRLLTGDYTVDLSAASPVLTPVVPETVTHDSVTVLTDDADPLEGL
jgi:hypothetical protein